MDDVIKKWQTSYGTLTLFYNNKITETNSCITTWTYDEFLNKCNSKVFCTLIKHMYGDNAFKEIIKLTQDEINAQEKEV